LYGVAQTLIRFSSKDGFSGDPSSQHMRTDGVKQSGMGTKKDDFRHRIATVLMRFMATFVVGDGKKIGSAI
jgi:hypothetical protein